MIVEADHFLDELMEFYRRAKKDGGAVSVTMKRLGRGEGGDSTMIYRAQWRKQKISTRIPSDVAQRFSTSVSNIVIASMDNLEKKAKLGRRKTDA